MTTAFTGFNDQDFDVFSVPGLEARMEALIEHVRPKLELIGAELAPLFPLSQARTCSFMLRSMPDARLTPDRYMGRLGCQ